MPDRHGRLDDSETGGARLGLDTHVIAPRLDDGFRLKNEFLVLKHETLRIDTGGGDHDEHFARDGCRSNKCGHGVLKFRVVGLGDFRDIHIELLRLNDVGAIRRSLMTRGLEAGGFVVRRFVATGIRAASRLSLVAAENR